MRSLSSLRSMVLLGLVAVFLSAGCISLTALAQDEGNPSAKGQLADGMYAVLNSARTAGELRPVDQGRRIVEDTRDAQWGEADSIHRFLLLNDKPNVPLRLAADPAIVEDQASGNRLDLRLVAGSAEKLSRFTREHLGGSGALIVDGRVVMVAKIRSHLTGGALQLSFCSEGAAERLRDKLRQPSAKVQIDESSPPEEK